uniref:Succinate dehydrogenase assembly factor 3 n=1 Tax=Phallusia mammillata TaxID=59560 RepID=A0A6F9D6E4_9ASCI|nr:protein ACN9 homolog, mitochondrial-like [Phallusia mammillata]
MSLKHTSKVRQLYKVILRLHEGLPIDLKTVGDQYVKSEFRAHKNCAPEFVPEFMSQWQTYAKTLQAQLQQESLHSKVGSSLPVDALEEFSEDQILQLHELLKETQKPNPQFDVKKETD